MANLYMMLKYFCVLVFVFVFIFTLLCVKNIAPKLILRAYKTVHIFVLTTERFSTFFPPSLFFSFFSSLSTFTFLTYFLFLFFFLFLYYFFFSQFSHFFSLHYTSPHHHHSLHLRPPSCRLLWVCDTCVSICFVVYYAAIKYSN